MNRFNQNMYFSMVNTRYNPLIVQFWDVFKWHMFNTKWDKRTLFDFLDGIKAVIQDRH